MAKPKVIAFYLPQFHRIPENDNWWGEGFTDWQSAKKAKPLFPGHYQPRVPDKDNYYNLLDKSSMEWQIKLAAKAGVYGFCMYHYWFGDKLLLEKPAENLLKWKELDINFCFSWANDTWIRSWSKLTGNAWLATEGNPENNDTGILIEQKYGGRQEWKKHFLYLLPFFQDGRYIKCEDKPVFILYKPENIPHLTEMTAYWSELAMENGLAGIFFIGTNCDRWRDKKLNAALQYEPIYTRFLDRMYDNHLEQAVESVNIQIKKIGLQVPQFLSYKRVWNAILQRDSIKNVFWGSFVDFDTTPRKGKRGIVSIGNGPDKFEEYFLKLYKKSEKYGKEFIFLTAWNEWGEGAYLEPDKRYGVRYLNAVRKVVRGRKTNREGECSENSSNCTDKVK